MACLTKTTLLLQLKKKRRPLEDGYNKYSGAHLVLDIQPWISLLMLDMITDLLFSITKHKLSPKHEKLTAEEKKRLLQKYELKEHQLSRMQANDAIARYYGYEKGQVLKSTHSHSLHHL